MIKIHLGDNYDTFPLFILVHVENWERDKIVKIIYNEFFTAPLMKRYL